MRPEKQILRRFRLPADICCMIDLDAETLAGDGPWRLVLAAYRAGQAQEVAKNPESDGWLPRLRSVEGIEGEELSKAHGQLIALGLLRFELAGRGEGLRYQVSTLGKQTLEHGTVRAAQSQDADDSSPQDDFADAA